MNSRIFPSAAMFLACLQALAQVGQVPDRHGVDRGTLSNYGYLVAAYVWPSCHADEAATRLFWPEGSGEWEVIRKATPRFDGHHQPRVPLWGYLMDDDPAVMERKIGAATAHHVNTFIFDWYWYDGKPFLEGSVDAFLAARNSADMDFYLMWANHDVPGNMWNPYRYPTDSIILRGTVDDADFRVVVDRMIHRFFKQPNYLKIDGRPVLSIYHLGNLLESFGGILQTKAAMDFFDDEVRKAGFGGLHLQLVGGDVGGEPAFWGHKPDDIAALIGQIGASSVTQYNMAGAASRKGDYLDYGDAGVELRGLWDSLLSVPFFPVVSVGWDDTPRYPGKGEDDVVHINNTPEHFGRYLRKAKDYVDGHPGQPPLIIINAWNEWVEGSYLEPDTVWGYGYLEAVNGVFKNGPGLAEAVPFSGNRLVPLDGSGYDPAPEGR